jgi:hypothetical protein
MIGFTFACKIINPLEIIIMMFIRFVLNYGFVRKKLLMKIRLRTLTTMLPSDRVLKYQYQARNYQRYSELIQDIFQAEKHDELTMRNHHQHSVGTATLPEVNYSSKGKEKTDGAKPSKNVDKFKK